MMINYINWYKSGSGDGWFYKYKASTGVDSLEYDYMGPFETELELFLHLANKFKEMSEGNIAYNAGIGYHTIYSNLIIMYDEEEKKDADIFPTWSSSE